MRKCMKSWLALGTAAMVAAGLTGCSGSKEAPATEAPKTETTAEAAADKTEAAAGTTATEEKKELEGELEIVTNANEQTYNAVNEILEQFMKENPGVKISYTTQGSDYEQLMKARMASNDLPDIFVTHGWSVVRYSEYLRPLNDQPWFSQIEPSFMENIEDENGQVYVLPINMDQGGLIYNKKLLTELGVDIPKTWDQLKDICEKGTIQKLGAVILIISCFQISLSCNIKQGCRLSAVFTCDKYAGVAFLFSFFTDIF